jgi:hypothetical protein
MVREAARAFYVPVWVAEAVWVFENGVPGYEGGQSTQAGYPRRWVPNGKGRQLFTMNQTIRRCVQRYMEKPYVRTSWSKSQLSESDFLWRYRQDFLAFMASEWKPRKEGETPEQSEAIWARGVRLIAQKRQEKDHEGSSKGR